MTIIDTLARPGAALVLLLASQLAGADDKPALWFGLADLSFPYEARVYAFDGGEVPPQAPLRYLPLAPDAATRVSCCLDPVDRAPKGPERATGPVLELRASGDRPARARALAPLASSVETPMIALALSGPAPKVKAVTAQRLHLTWPDRPAWRVEHCFSQGLHLRIQPEDGSAPARALYLPLSGEGVADCPRHMLARPSAPAAAPVRR